MKTNEMIDVLIPAYNVEKYIESTLTSLVNQTYKNLRIIIVDDGSTDKTQEIIKQFQKEHKNIELFSKENEKSISKTRNYLLTKIKSQYFSFFDSDDIAEPTYFEELYRLIKTYNADISMCSKIRHKLKGVNFEKLNKNKGKVTVLNQQEALAEMISSNLYNGTCPMKLFKTHLVENEKFDTSIHYGEDLDFCFKLMKKATKIVLTEKILYHYVIRKNSIVTSKFNIKKVTCVDCYENIVNNIKSNEELFICAKSMQGLIAIEILYYTWRDKYKDKELKTRLKTIIKESIPYIRKNKRLSKLLRCTPLVWRLTKIM